MNRQRHKRLVPWHLCVMVSNSLSPDEIWDAHICAKFAQTMIRLCKSCDLELFQILTGAGKQVGFLTVMPSAGKQKIQSAFNERLATGGFRFTRQRQHVYDVLLAKRDHPTAEEVFIRAKTGMSDISMATVYNCLTALVKCGLVRQVALERGAARFCPNMKEHCHFYCETCDGVFDVDWSTAAAVELPGGFKAQRYELAIHGQCPACARRSSN
jgi:Fe2+ or Zn2+ uptake regulation protein